MNTIDHAQVSCSKGSAIRRAKDGLTKRFYAKITSGSSSKKKRRKTNSVKHIRSFREEWAVVEGTEKVTTESATDPVESMANPSEDVSTSDKVVMEEPRATKSLKRPRSVEKKRLIEDRANEKKVHFLDEQLLRATTSAAAVNADEVNMGG